MIGIKWSETWEFVQINCSLSAVGRHFILAPDSPEFESRLYLSSIWLFFCLQSMWVHSVWVVVSDWQGVGGVLDVCVSVQCTHSVCQKQWTQPAREWGQMARMAKLDWLKSLRQNRRRMTNSRSCYYQPGSGLTRCQSLKVEDGGKGHTHEGDVGSVNAT